MQKTLKALIVGIIGLLAVGCASTPTMKNVAGTYEIKFDGDTLRMVLLKNGIGQGYINGKKNEDEGKWKIINKEIHAGDEDGKTAVFRINKDSSLNLIARIDRDGKREDAPKELNLNYKKIK
jgi:hypothetical protein